MKILIVGPGRVGCCLARLFAASGIEVTLCGRTPPVTHPSSFDLVLLAVPDGAIEEAAATVAGWNPGGPLLHTSGFRPPRLPPAQPLTAGSLHPAAAFPSPELPVEMLRRVVFLVQGTPEARATAGRLLDCCRLTAVTAEQLDPAAYHAGCVMAANFTALMGLAARRLMVAAGVTPEQAYGLVESLVASVAGREGALTGPAARGNLETVTAEAELVARVAPELAELFLAGNLAIGRECGQERLVKALAAMRPPPALEE